MKRKRLFDQIAMKCEKSLSEVIGVGACQNGFCYFRRNKPLLG